MILIGWRYRKLKSVIGTTAGAQINYQLKITVHKSIGIDTNTDIYLGSNVRNDFGDIRFTKSDGITILNYWIETLTSGISASIWVNIPSIPISPGTTLIYIYYDNPSATSLSNGSNTFMFFDDFSGNLSKWTVLAGSNISIINGVMDIPAQPNEGITFENTLNTNNYSLELIAKWISNSSGQGSRIQISFAYISTNTSIRMRTINTSIQCDYSVLGAYTNIGQIGVYNAVDGAYHSWQFIKLGSSNQFMIFIDGNKIGATQVLPAAFNTTTNIGVSTFNSHDQVDNIKVRSYSNPEPTFGATIITQSLLLLYNGSLYLPENRGITTTIGTVCGRKRLRNR